MDKIERIEKLSVEWKAAYNDALKNLNFEMADSVGYKRIGLKAALAILKEPSNTQMHTDAFECKNCGFNDGPPELQCPMCHDAIKRK